MTQLGDIPANAPLPFPTAGIVMWGGDTAPDGFRLCNGVVLPASAYPALAARLGGRYGGDGSSSFGIPDLRRRIPIGKAAAGARSTLGVAGGAFDHTHGKGSLAGVAHYHSDGSIYVPSHGHGHNFSIGGHQHTMPLRAYSSGSSQAELSNATITDVSGAGVGGSINGSGDIDVTGRTDDGTPAVAAGQSAPANPAFVTLNFLIGASTMQFGDVRADVDLMAAAGPLFLTGMIIPTGRRKSAIGNGWLPCDGLLRNIADYPALFAVIGHRFNRDGLGNIVDPGGGQFRLPDFSRAFPLGLDAALGAIDGIGKRGGSWDHTHAPGGLAMADHSHGGSQLYMQDGSGGHGHGHGLYMADHSHNFSSVQAKVDWGGYNTDIAARYNTGGSGNIGLPGGISRAGAIQLGGSTGGSSDTGITGASGSANPPHYFLNFKIKV